ncbi:MAG: 1,4-dihydroxy-6-naphthoate synthase [Ferruginibacter sp.]|nr:1,4-dihydroxy-6-naphthoate synthase [Ferruginibacter sp.]
MHKQIITIGFSPCPNDTFIFDALVNNKIDTGNLLFEPILEDVQTLNQWAIQAKLHVTKLSFGVLPLVLHNYNLLYCGSALGKGVGPLLISKNDDSIKNIDESLIAIPGENTTAHLLFSLAYPNAKNKIFLRYNQIEDFVLSNKGLGVIIHENRFTYAQKGLIKITDLGQYWESKTQYPIPLGGIVVQKTMQPIIQQQINYCIKNSIEFAFSNYPILNDYIRTHAQEMNEDIMRKHIDLYVNNYTLNLGKDGIAAVEMLLQIFANMRGKKNELQQNFLIPNVEML